MKWYFKGLIGSLIGFILPFLLFFIWVKINCQSNCGDYGMGLGIVFIFSLITAILGAEIGIFFNKEYIFPIILGIIPILIYIGYWVFYYNNLPTIEQRGLGTQLFMSFIVSIVLIPVFAAIKKYVL